MISVDPASHRQCPQCDYNLTGLPDEHTCPECGFAFDAYSTCIRLSARENYRHAQVMIVFWILYFVFVVWRQVGPSRMSASILVLFSLVAVGRLLYESRRIQTAADRMIFARAGLSFYSTTSTSIPIPWSIIKSASCSWVDGSLRIERTDDNDPIKFSHRELGGVRIGKRCAAEINRLKSVYVEGIAVNSPL